jgi:tRNA 2-thiouridine synthesizing protein C
LEPEAVTEIITEAVLESCATRKTLTFITRKAPYGQSYAKACLDMVLSASVFDQKVNYVFMDDGVYQLLKNQAPAGIHAKNLSAAFPALELYDIEQVFVDEASLLTRGLGAQSLCLPSAVICSIEQIQALINNSDVVFNL